MNKFVLVEDRRDVLLIDFIKKLVKYNFIKILESDRVLLIALY